MAKRKHTDQQQVSTTKPTKRHASSSHEENASSYSSSSDDSSDTSEAPMSKKPQTTKSLTVGDSSKKATVAIAAAEEEVENKNKLLFQRVFSEEDEIILLQGLFEFLKESGVDENCTMDMVGFHEYIKESFHTQITKAQLSEKIKRLKRRFKNNQDRVFKPDSHEKKVFELCRKIWCIKDSEGKSVPTTNPSSQSQSQSVGKPEFNLCYTSYEDDLARIAFGTTEIEGASADQKKRLMELKVAACESIIRHNLLKNEKIKFFMELFQSEAK